MSVLSIILFELGLSLGFVYLMMGIFIGSAVMQVAFGDWKDASATGAIASAVIGQICAMITWIVCSTFERDADGKHGTVDLDTLGGNYPMLAGNVMAIGMSGLVCAVISKMNPQNFDFNTLKDGIALIDDKLPELDPEENDQAMLDASLKWITKWGVGRRHDLHLAGVVLAGWLRRRHLRCLLRRLLHLVGLIALAWGLLATVVIIVLPLYESKEVLGDVIKGISPVPSEDSRKYFIVFTTTSSCTQTPRCRRAHGLSKMNDL